jgi:hypothetical protein
VNLGNYVRGFLARQSNSEYGAAKEKKMVNTQIV